MGVRAISARGLGLAAVILAAGTAARAEVTEFEFTDFDRIVLSEAIELTVTTGAEAYAVRGEAGGLSGTARLQVKQEGDTLKIERTERWSPMMGLLDGQLRVYVDLPELKELTVDSAALARVSGKAAQTVVFNVDSGGQLEVSQLDSELVRVHASSGGDLEISGRCSTLDVTASSGADVDLEDLRCQDVRVVASSGADVDVTATTRLQGDASSGGDISVEGQPAQREVRSSSGGNISFDD
ncbi:head GIN domain-containing protein [Tritonibacter mobilis]|uniref:head GIN domain-containing protein n=1 Tax=Tritonibacter mobilis TaxID=379347 RepID=UPI0039A6EF9C